MSNETVLWQISQKARTRTSKELCMLHDWSQKLSIEFYAHYKRHGNMDCYMSHRKFQPIALIYWREMCKRAGNPNIGAI